METENIMEFNLEEEYLSTIDIVSGLPLPLKEETFIIDSHHNVDLDIALYQYACMSVPMKILCKEDCSGLCSICGENLNEHLCKCAQGRIDNH